MGTVRLATKEIQHTINSQVTPTKLSRPLFEMEDIVIRRVSFELAHLR